MAADPGGHELLVHVNTLLPLGDLVVTAHEPVVTSTNDGWALLAETEAIRAVEGGTGHYSGTIAGPFTGPFGVAKTPGRSSFSIPSALVLAHELGHNLNLDHAPCGTPGDPLYPYPDGSIGAWGYDSRFERLWPPDDSYDLMSYCGPKWISDHYFEQAFRFRVADEAASGTAAAGPDRSVLLWGGIGSDGQPYLEPAFVLDARPALPESGGDYRIAGRTREGAELFDCFHDARSGQVREFLRDPTATLQVAADAGGKGLAREMDMTGLRVDRSCRLLCDHDSISV